MVDGLFLLGQILSVIGLVYGAYLSLSCRDCAKRTSDAQVAKAMLHHWALT